MKIYILPRRAGKTTKMIKWLKEKDGRILIVANYTIRICLEKIYPELKDRIVDIHSYLNGECRGKNFEEISIDNAEFVLEEMFDKKIANLTMTEDKHENKLAGVKKNIEIIKKL